MGALGGVWDWISLSVLSFVSLGIFLPYVPLEGSSYVLNYEDKLSQGLCTGNTKRACYNGSVSPNQERLSQCLLNSLLFREF